jgi:hypothetical protein
MPHIEKFQPPPNRTKLEANPLTHGPLGGYSRSKLQQRLYSEFPRANLKQTKMPFLKNGEQEGKTGPVWGLVPVGGGRI